MSVPFVVIPGLPVSRQIRAGLIKRQPSAGFFKPPWCQFLSSPSTGCPCLQANQGRPDEKATQRRLFEAALVSVPFVVTHGLPVSRQTRADLITKATQGRLFKAASESAIERIELGPTRQIPPGPWPPSVRLCGSNWGWLFPVRKEKSAFCS